MGASRPTDRLLPWSALILLAVFSALGPGAPRAAAATAAAGAVLAAIAAVSASPAAKRITAVTALLMLFALTGALWQIVMALAVGPLVLAGRRWPAWRATVRRGTVPWPATLATAAVTPVALVAWVAWLHPDLRDVVEQYVPSLPTALLAAGAVLFVMVNAALEEAIWRGVFQDGLQTMMRPGAANVVQAVSFGILHAHGVPRGGIGVVLAGVWAVMLGALRRRANGLLAPFIAHAVADATIAVIILALYHR
jgi:membrane protease YdiL (CAAX protease family)